jgi:hypothetical protein
MIVTKSPRTDPDSTIDGRLSALKKVETGLEETKTDGSLRFSVRLDRIHPRA